MAGRFVNPLPQFSDATPTMYAGAKVFFYATGTSTKLSTYTTKALSVANPNPVVLNSAGRLPNDVFLQDLEYKVVLAPSTDSDPPSSPIWTADPVSHRDQSLVAKTITGSGSPNGVVAGTAGSASILPDQYWDFTGLILYFCSTTGTSSTAVWTAINASSAAAVVPPPQGYLTLTSATPVILADVTAATSVFYTPDSGNLVPIYNGSSFTPTAFTELTLTLSSSHVASKIYDIFVFSNSGVLTIVTGPSWDAGTSGSVTAGSCARGTGAGGTALSRVNGIYTNAVQITGRNGATTFTIGANLATYVGSLFMDGTNGQVSCHRAYGQSRKWGLWNCYNRRPLYLKAGDGTSSWSYTTNTTRASNGSSANSLTVFQGLAEQIYDFIHAGTIVPGSIASGATGAGLVAIGYNSTTVASGKTGFQTLTNSTGGAVVVGGWPLNASYKAPPALGINVITALESGLGSTAGSFNGAEASMVLSANWAG